MTTLAFVETGSGNPVLWVPAAAVRSRNGAWYVTRHGPGGPVETPIQIGMRNEGRVEIRSGLTEGAEVIVP
jgi:multidrug efflux pump subunit AcrA (membrane-fusion protein)